MVCAGRLRCVLCVPIRFQLCLAGGANPSSEPVVWMRERKCAEKSHARKREKARINKAVQKVCLTQPSPVLPLSPVLVPSDVLCNRLTR
jgi:hypothetical protein